ncbi:hypothetical protein HDV06_002876 [Boothiomyces sp. JEL0866]|nr:hypothetical protein HDV06_002876 [Boothiomyces sp. JEL0866]
MIYLTALLYNQVNAHGFLVHPGPIEDAKKYHAVRNYDAISIDIQSLRAPDPTKLLCRGASKGTVTPITLQNGQPFTVTCAYSMNAFHVGPCSVDIIDADNTNSIVAIGSQMGCARPPFAKLNTDGLVGHPATLVCPDAIPANLATNDMCLSEWTFTVQNADQIKCKNCILRWNWEARHISTPGEFYQNCADVDITVIGASQFSGKGPVQQNLGVAKESSATSVKTLVTPITPPKLPEANLPPEPIMQSKPSVSPLSDFNVAPINLPPKPVIEITTTQALGITSKTFGSLNPEYTIKDSSSDFETITPQVTVNYPDITGNIEPTRAIYVSSSLQLASGILTGLFILLALQV